MVAIGNMTISVACKKFPFGVFMIADEQHRRRLFKTVGAVKYAFDKRIRFRVKGRSFEAEGQRKRWLSAVNVIVVSFDHVKIGVPGFAGDNARSRAIEFFWLDVQVWLEP